MLPAPSLPDDATILPDGALNCPNPISQYNEAFEFAFQFDITTMPTCAKARMGSLLLRKDAAKMMVNFAINILHKAPDTNRRCNFRDMRTEDVESQQYAVLACQLGIM